jgi:hypothetical protein
VIAEILIAEGRYGACHWRQYLVVTDERVVVVHMEPTIWGGWRFLRIDVQDGEEWRGMTIDAILRYKTVPGHVPAIAPIWGDFRARLLAVAKAGKLPSTLDAA